MRTAIVWSFVVAVGCVDARDDESSTASPVFAGEMQGRRLLGRFADGLATAGMHFRVEASATNRPVTLTVRNAELVATTGSTVVYSGADPAFIGLRMSGAAGGELEIRDVGALSASTAGYRLRYRASPSALWEKYCDDGGLAVPFQGRWTTAGLHQLHGEISFSCDDGAGWKCVDWGYIPGGRGPGTRMWDPHQACTRMARADYCADGTPHTLDLTPVLIRDQLPGGQPASPPLIQVTPWPPPLDEFIFEGAWRGGSDVPVCLSRARWASQPIGGDCGGDLEDPRVQDSAKFCDDMTITEMIGLGALVFNASKTNELRMHRWHNPATGDHVVTMSGYYPAAPPFGAYVYGASDGVLLRNLPGSIHPSEVVPVFDYQLGADHVVAPEGVLTSHTRGAFEGWMYLSDVVEPGIPPRTDLRLWHDGTDYVTTVAPTLSGYTLDGDLGYVTAP